MTDKKNIENKNTKKPDTGAHKMHKDSKIEDTATDVYYKTKCKIKNSKVSVPTEDAVKEAKEWVDEKHKM